MPVSYLKAFTPQTQRVLQVPLQLNTSHLHPHPLVRPGSSLAGLPLLAGCPPNRHTLLSITRCSRSSIPNASRLCPLRFTPQLQRPTWPLFTGSADKTEPRTGPHNGSATEKIQGQQGPCTTLFSCSPALPFRAQPHLPAGPVRISMTSTLLMVAVL